MQELMPNLAALPRPIMLMAKNAMVRPGPSICLVGALKSPMHAAGLPQ
jgi:hypothetical protein